MNCMTFHPQVSARGWHQAKGGSYLLQEVKRGLHLGPAPRCLALGLLPCMSVACANTRLRTPSLGAFLCHELPAVRGRGNNPRLKAALMTTRPRGGDHDGQWLQTALSPAEGVAIHTCSLAHLFSSAPSAKHLRSCISQASWSSGSGRKVGEGGVLSSSVWVDLRLGCDSRPSRHAVACADWACPGLKPGLPPPSLQLCVAGRRVV